MTPPPLEFFQKSIRFGSRTLPLPKAQEYAIISLQIVQGSLFQAMPQITNQTLSHHQSMLRSKKDISLQITKSFVSPYLMYADDYEGNLHFLKLCSSWLFFPPRGGA